MLARPRVLAAALAASAITSIAALGLVAWIASAPEWWFPGAYAEQGPPGEKGPLGDRGPAGPPGPVGPSAADAVSALEAEIGDLVVDNVDQGNDISELRNALEELVFQLDRLGTMSGGTELEDTARGAADAIEALCNEFSYYDGALGDIYLSAC